MSGAGYTPYQKARFADIFCENGHRFNGANFPTPEGVCPFCAWPEVRAELHNYERLVAEQQTRQSQHPSVGLQVQSPPPSLTASSE